MQDIEVPDETVAQMVEMGFAIVVEHPVARETIAIMTPKGEKWLQEYCESILGAAS